MEKAFRNSSTTNRRVRIPVAGKLLDKRTGRGIEGATVHFVGAPQDNAITSSDGSFATHSGRGRFHQILVWLDEQALRSDQFFRIRMDNSIKEDIAANLQIHIDPERLSQQHEFGDGIFCDGIHCVMCNPAQSQSQLQWLQTLQALQVQLKQFQIEKQNLQYELYPLEY